MFVLQQRLPIGLMRGGWRPWLSTMGTNLALLAFAGVTVWLLGWQAVLFVSLPTAVLAATAGVWLFFVQHQFEETHWTRNAAWDLRGAALKGSSHYDLPPIARWFTANIGLHHVHHLSSRIPSYRLGEVLKDLPQLGAPGRITVPQSFRCIGLALWDEASQRLVSFAEYRQLYGPAGAALG
jgi:omega-6 fatty acid desaturase (delta-12 desaturase)